MASPAEPRSLYSPKKPVNLGNKWGEFVITPALMMGIEDIILDRIAFGSVISGCEFYKCSQPLVGYEDI
jgi:hypothetical protein